MPAPASSHASGSSDLASRILIVDDEADTCANLRDILTDFGYEADVAPDGEQALEMARRRHYDLALLDYRMPGMNGVELSRRLQELGTGTVAILVTAYASQETSEQALAAGAWKIVSKPVEIGSLLPLVDEALERPLLLVVDDDHELCLSLRDLFHERNYRTSIAHSTSEAVACLEQRRFRVVLVDWKLPEGDGGSVLELVRSNDPQARTILITGRRDELLRRLGAEAEASADAICYKPFDVDRLLATVRQFTGRG